MFAVFSRIYEQGSEKGKPLERVGRKAAGLHPNKVKDMAAGLPSKDVTSIYVLFAR
jgi:hypothetical protein